MNLIKRHIYSSFWRKKKQEVRPLLLCLWAPCISSNLPKLTQPYFQMYEKYLSSGLLLLYFRLLLRDKKRGFNYNLEDRSWWKTNFTSTANQSCVQEKTFLTSDAEEALSCAWPAGQAASLRESLFYFSPVLSCEREGRNNYFDLTPFLFLFSFKKEKNKRTHFQGYEAAKT